MKHLHHKLYIIYPFVMLVLMALLLNSIATKTGLVAGLEPVSCIDQSKPFEEDYSIRISININGKITPLDPNIGHDPGRCLREIHTDDRSGIVSIQKNNKNIYYLSDFFQVWRKPFDDTKLLNMPIDSYHKVSVLVNGLVVQNPAQVILSPNSQIEIYYH